jgi:hypothetical protein
MAEGPETSRILDRRLVTDKDGQQRTGLSVSAWQVTLLGQIGRRKPKVQSRGEDAVPFDDPLRF